MFALHDAIRVRRLRLTERSVTFAFQACQKKKKKLVDHTTICRVFVHVH